jgi:hypothetical protein
VESVEVRLAAAAKEWQSQQHGDGFSFVFSWMDFVGKVIRVPGYFEREKKVFGSSVG